MIAWIKRLVARPAAPAKPARTGQRLYAGAKGGRLMFTASSSSATLAVPAVAAPAVG